MKRPPPPSLENRNRVLKMHVPISPMFQGQLIEKKIRTITYVVCALHYIFSRSKYFHLMIAPLEGFITLIE